MIEEAKLEHIDAFSLLAYAEKAISGRELCKFHFSKLISKSLDLIGIWSDRIGITREQVSWLEIEEILEVLNRPILSGTQEYFQEKSLFNRSQCHSGRGLKLGYLIRSERDLFVAPLHRSAPNYITQGCASGKVVYLSSFADEASITNGCIVCIESADPGYDWIFSRHIGGLITQFGGTNSHMAIRCAEYGIVAAIGCGEVLFKKILLASKCEIDAEKKQIRII